MKPAVRLFLVALIATWLGCSSSSSDPGTGGTGGGGVGGNGGIDPGLTPPPPTGYADRVEAYFQATLDAEPKNLHTEVMRLARGVAPDESKIQHALDRIHNREDTSDFNFPSLFRMLYEYGDSELLSEEILSNTKEVLLKHKYWPDERLNEDEWLPRPDPPEDMSYVPTTDSAVYLTENHHILYSMGGYLAGQLWPDEVFAASNETGSEKMETFRPRVMKWLELRYKSGFSEWLSNVYYNEDMPALVALADLAEDPEIRTRAAMVLDLVLADIALNSYRGSFGSTHGRTYEQKFGGRRDSTRTTSQLVFGLNEGNVGDLTASQLALSASYVPPRVVYDIANDGDRPEVENRQRMGIRLEEAESWGLDLERFEDGMTFMTLEAYTHYLSIGLWVEMLDAYGWWAHDDYKLFAPFQSVLRNPVVRHAFAQGAEKDITRNMREEVNIYTYRTPDYMLSTAQDWRDPHRVDHVGNESGYGGDQQSLWQATLGMDAVVFTTHPGADNWGNPTPSYWTGYGTMPRTIQLKNVVISLYRIETGETLYVENQRLWTHAFFDKSRFDETVKEGGWFFGRYAHPDREGSESYVALWVSDPEADWLTNDDPERQDLGDHEIIACPEGYPTEYYGYEACQDREGYGTCEDPAECNKTVWISELGSADEYADFDAFKAAILAAPLTVDVQALTVDYESPSQGRLVMGWNGEPLTQDGVPVDVKDYPRYDNPYGTTSFRDDVIVMEYEDPMGQYQTTSMTLSFENATREVSHPLE